MKWVYIFMYFVTVFTSGWLPTYSNSVTDREISFRREPNEEYFSKKIKSINYEIRENGSKHFDHYSLSGTRYIFKIFFFCEVQSFLFIYSFIR